ncbi:hypothetical protein [Melissospora conviva]|jgi:hypothetical protein|uniref:hypothetical protein n=1 Tax=Melissospora conviva TaxID=3388432 RepID=UPI003B79368D
MTLAGDGAPAGPDEYVEAEIQHLLTETPQVAEQGITVARLEGALMLQGQVESAQRREEILTLIAERFPGTPVVSGIGITGAPAPTEAEELS